MDEEVLKKKHDVRKILKFVIDNSTKEVESLMKENVNEESIETLKTLLEVLRRKVAAVKTLEEEILSIFKNSEDMEEIITEGMTFEIIAKSKLNLIQKFLNKYLQLENVDKKVAFKGELRANFFLPKISTFSSKKCDSNELEKVSVHLKNSKEKFEVEALCTPFICLPVKKQSTDFAKNNFDYLRVRAG